MTEEEHAADSENGEREEVPADVDETGADGPELLEAASWWFTAAGVFLLLPRQWASAGIALGLGLVLRVWHSRRERARNAATPVDR